MSDNDDVLIGRILTRREVLGLLGSAGAALLVACTGSDSSSPSPTSNTGAVATEGVATQAAAATATAIPACVVVPALTEGPYFVDEKINRSDIRSDTNSGAVRPGSQFELTINVGRVANGACTALAGAMVDIWHCDALGVYSDASDPGFNTKGQNFLRGYQVTDNNGKVKFTTIYPGWYQGRAVHIHFKIRNGNSEFTSQFFFDETMNDSVFAQAPYNTKTGNRLKNSGDSIYNQSGGQTLLQVAKSGSVYTAEFDIGLRA